jgi:hypothetical protein
MYYSFEKIRFAVQHVSAHPGGDIRLLQELAQIRLYIGRGPEGAQLQRETERIQSRLVLCECQSRGP